VGRMFPLRLWVVVLAACAFLFLPRVSGAGTVSYKGISPLVFHLTTYDEASRPVEQGQGVMVGPDTAIVSVTTLEGSAGAVARMMNGSSISVGEVYAVDEMSGLAKVHLLTDASGHLPVWFESVLPRAGERVLFSSLTARGKQVCMECTVTSARAVPAVEGLYYLETTRPVPRPGGPVFDSDGGLVGIIVMRFGSGHSGLLASGERVAAFAGSEGQKAVPDVRANRSDSRWSDTVCARYMRGQVALWQGQPQTAMGLMEDHFWSAGYLKENMAALLGEAYLAADLFPEAILAFKSAIDTGSPPCEVYRKLAWAYMETAQYDLSEKLCSQAIRMDPDHSPGYVLLARLKNLRGDFKQAVYEARRAILREPNCSCAYFERGRGYLGLAMYREAAQSFKKATSIDPEYTEAFNSLGYAYLRQGKPLQAIVVLKEAVEREPEMEAAWDNLGEAYSRSGLSDKALDAFRMTVCLDPSRSHVYGRLAREYMEQGLYDKAEDTLLHGLERCEKSQWLIYYLGKTYCLDGSIDHAMEQAELLEKTNKALAGQLLRIINASNRG